MQWGRSGGIQEGFWSKELREGEAIVYEESFTSLQATASTHSWDRTNKCVYECVKLGYKIWICRACMWNNSYTIVNHPYISIFVSGHRVEGAQKTWPLLLQRLLCSFTWLYLWAQGRIYLLLLWFRWMLSKTCFELWVQHSRSTVVSPQLLGD